MTDKQEKPVILAVDDAPENLDVVKSILVPEYLVKAATSGPMALKIAGKQPPDLVLLDIMMPDMDGYEVCRRLKADPATAQIPVIFLTAKDQAADEAAGFEIGAADYILKPVNPAILNARVRTHVALKRSMDQLHTAYQLIRRQKERMQTELDVGHEIQMSMVPQQFPAFADREEFDIHAVLRPAREIGGDFYDYYFVSRDQLCIVIGDVSGKGVPAALFMAVSQTLIKAYALDDHSTASIATRVNEEISQDNPSCMFVTLFVALLNVQTGELHFTNAGHNPSYVHRSDGQIERLDDLHGPVIGAMDGIAYKGGSLTLGKGDRLLMYTDGVSEAMDVSDQLFGDQRLVDKLSASRQAQARACVEELVAAVDDFAGEAEQADDITVVALDYLVAPQAMDSQALVIEVAPDLAEIDRVNELLKNFAQVHQVPQEVVLKLSVVFDELINNIISYAYEQTPKIAARVTIELLAGQLTIELSDEGIPFNPLLRAEPDTSAPLEEREIGGLGIHIVKQLMDETSYQRKMGRNVLTLIKNL